MQPHMEHLRMLAALYTDESGVHTSLATSGVDNPESADAKRESRSQLVSKVEQLQRATTRPWSMVAGDVLTLLNGGATPESARGLLPKWWDASAPTKASQASNVRDLVEAGVLPPTSEVTLSNSSGSIRPRSSDSRRISRRRTRTRSCRRLPLLVARKCRTRPDPRQGWPVLTLDDRATFLDLQRENDNLVIAGIEAMFAQGVLAQEPSLVKRELTPLVVNGSWAAAAIGSATYQASRGNALGTTASAFIAHPVVRAGLEAAVDATIDWGLKRLSESETVQTALGDLKGGLTRHVRSGARTTLEQGVRDDPAGALYRRVPRRGGCEWCLMLAWQRVLVRVDWR